MLTENDELKQNVGKRKRNKNTLTADNQVTMRMTTIIKITVPSSILVVACLLAISMRVLCCPENK